MLVEGYEEISLALESGGTPERLFHCPELARQSDEALLLRLAIQGCEILPVRERAFARLAYREHPDGWLAVFKAPSTELGRLTPGPNPLVLVAESVEKPGNLGAMLRTADAAGVNALIAADPRTDWANPNIIRASKGTVFSVPVAQASSEETVEWLRERGIALLAAVPDAGLSYTQADLSGAIAVIVGTEKEGLSSALLAAADHRVRIPMSGRVNSLNVSTAAALLIYEALRQRTEAGR